MADETKILVGDDFFTEDHSANEPKIEEKKPEIPADEKAKRVLELKTARNSAVSTYIKNNPHLGMAGSPEAGKFSDDQISVLEDLAGVRIKTHSQDPTQAVAFDRQTGKFVAMEDVFTKAYTKIPGLRSVEADALIKAKAEIADKVVADPFAPPAGPSAKYLPGLDMDPSLPEEVLKSRQLLLAYFNEDGSPKVSPMENKFFAKLLYQSKWGNYVEGHIVNEIHSDFLTTSRLKTARSISREALIAMEPAEFKQFAINEAKSTLVERFKTERPGEGWQQILAERNKKHSVADDGPYTGTAYAGMDPDVRRVMIGKGISKDAAEAWVANAKRRGWKI